LALGTTANRHSNIGKTATGAAAACLLIAGAVRYFEAPSFWLDEAFIAVSLKDPSLHALFGRLEYGQLFPRIYLSTIAALRGIFGYEISILRLLPSLCFAMATILWARLMWRRARSQTLACLLGAALLMGASAWLDQSIQLKQYTFDVLLAFVPFLFDDEFFSDALASDRRKTWLIALALPCMLSYTYPMALGARVGGWYLYHRRRNGWALRRSAVTLLLLLVVAGIGVIWLTDHRFNLKDSASYLNYWNDCILRARLRDGPAATLGLLAKFFWGWHGRTPLITAVIVPLQIAGVYRILRAWRSREHATGQSDSEPSGDQRWGSRSLGSLVLLTGVLTASLLVNYPICSGRVVLFTEFHTQIPAIEGVLLVLGISKVGRWGKLLLSVFILIVIVQAGVEYARVARSEPAENLRPVVRLIDPRVASVVWVHPCSVAQVRSLPDATPVERVLLGNKQPQPPRGEKVWVLWSHLGNESCLNSLDKLRSEALQWQLVVDGPGRGLALAEF